MAKVLVTDGGYKNTLGIVRSLAKLGHTVDCIGQKRSVCAFSKHLGKVAYPQTRFSEHHFEEFLSFLTENHYDFLIPIGGKSVELVSKNLDRVLSHVTVELPEHNTLKACLDKNATMILAKRVGVFCPETWGPVRGNVPDESVCFPAVVKGNSEVCKLSPSYVNNPEELAAAISLHSKIGDVIIQRRIEGVGIGFFALYEHGVLKHFFMHRRVREMPPSGGASTCAVSIDDPDVYQNGKRILDGLRWHGVAMVEFKREFNTNKLFLMEVNPKFWGSHDLAVASGVNFAALLIAQSEGRSVSEPAQYRVGLKYHWPLDGDIKHALMVPKHALNLMKDSIDLRVKSNLSFADPLPTIQVLVFGVLRYALRLSRMDTHVSRARKLGIKVAVVRGVTELSGIPAKSYSKLSDSIYFGMRPGLLGIQFLRRWGVTAILNLQHENRMTRCEKYFEWVGYQPVKEFTAPTLKQLSDGADFIDRVLNSEGCIYVHCREGVSRAPLFVAAYLVKYEELAPESALHVVRRARSFISVLPEQHNALLRFHETCTEA